MGDRLEGRPTQVTDQKRTSNRKETRSVVDRPDSGRDIGQAVPLLARPRPSLSTAAGCLIPGGAESASSIFLRCTRRLAKGKARAGGSDRRLWQPKFPADPVCALD